MDILVAPEKISKFCPEKKKSSIVSFRDGIKNLWKIMRNNYQPQVVRRISEAAIVFFPSFFCRRFFIGKHRDTQGYTHKDICFPYFWHEIREMVQVYVQMDGKYICFDGRHGNILKMHFYAFLGR